MKEPPRFLTAFPASCHGRMLYVFVLSLLAISFTATTLSHASVSTLASGDISITGMNQDAPDQFSFVTFVDIAPCTVIYFTDRGWKADCTWRCSSEGIATWTAPAGGVTAGTIIVGNDSDSDGDVCSFSIGTYCNAQGGAQTLQYTACGDSTIAFQAPAASYCNPCDAQMLAALHTKSCFDADSTSTTTTAVPKGLVDGTTAYAHGHHDNMRVTNATLTQASQSPSAWLSDFACYCCNWESSNPTPYTCGAHCGLMTQSSIAVTQDVERHWDTDGATAGISAGGGTWGTDSYWGNDACGAWGTGDWQDNRISSFGGSDGCYAITVCGTQEVGGLKFTANGYTLSGGTINMNDSTPTIEVAAGDTVIIASVISDSGTNGIDKTGAGNLTLTGNNTYNGDTVISAGTLILGTNNVIDNTSDLELDGGTLNTGGFDETMGNLTLTQNGVIDMAAGDSILNFEDFIDTATEIQIWNWSGTTNTGGGTDQLIFDRATFGALSAGQLAKFKFYTGSGTGLFGGTTTQLIGGEVLPLVAVPEPASWLSSLCLSTAACHLFHRRRKEKQSL